MRTIYDLSLHESLTIDPTMTVMRVPGGWAYFFIGDDKAMFVPLNYEFDTTGLPAPTIDPNDLGVSDNTKGEKWAT